MRILAVTNLYPTASMPGCGVFVAEQVRGLQEIGLAVEVHFVDRVTKGMGAYYTMLDPIRQAVHRFAPDVLHVMYGGVMADLVMRKVNCRPKVVTYHGSDLLGENLSGVWRKVVSHYGVFCSRRAAWRADGVIVVAERLKLTLPGNLPPEKVRVIPCGIDLERFRPLNQSECRRQLGWSGATFHVLFPSRRTNSVKRPALAVTSVERLRSLGVNAELHFLENVRNDEVPVWMNASDALILTSAHEGSPTVVKEALGCGLPLVSVDVGDVAERIEGIEGCYLAAPDSTDLAAKLHLLQRSGRRVQARQRIERLAFKSIARDLSSYYEELVRATGRSRA